ncbi:CRP/FNR family transcriptional regulator, anaerobic regulatory protein [Muriicola jejuensis]|uniref:Helix-turn-helix domain-containing protein n=1 Tax=Muriicola jejuensis TaxID=504488 RepID=A0A6P0UK29_9FLAO|nr:Crp/Fnr family transcriptional regulator [Muriicola jejuensis]NER10576.1 helix-turn-helix domain-containing protein [Muriicola jejuensis]SMP17895.1 CRP/FNR family transcriptional regulator, anaerobic regulatory protein [Muriicola jejuensis]
MKEQNKNELTLEYLKDLYGYLFEDELIKEIHAAGKFQKVEQGNYLMDIGDEITFMPLIFSGAIKIMSEDERGDDLLLYFIEKGDTCAMTLSCCVKQGRSNIRAVAESDVELLMIPVDKMEDWMGKYRSWRAFILDSYHNRMQELLETVDTLAFMNMDERLLKYLRDKAMVNHDDVIHTTHQEIAADLHTSRVVVSRLLKKMEREGKIDLQRSQIKVNSL